MEKCQKKYGKCVKFGNFVASKRCKKGFTNASPFLCLKECPKGFSSYQGYFCYGSDNYSLRVHKTKKECFSDLNTGEDCAALGEGSGYVKDSCKSGYSRVEETCVRPCPRQMEHKGDGFCQYPMTRRNAEPAAAPVMFSKDLLEGKWT